MNVLRNTFGTLALLALISCRPPSPSSNAELALGETDGVQLKDEVYANLADLARSGRFMFGQQRLNLSGVGREGQRPWSDGSYGTEPDAQQLVGDQPAVLGMDVWDFAMKNPTWNQSAYAKAARDFYSSGTGGMITFDWHMRACDVQDVYDYEGRRGVPGHGFTLNDWNGDSNRSCLCRIVNEEPWINGLSWKDWLFTQKLDRFASKLQTEGLDQMPIILRPFHEMNGSWFWWGAKSWDCEKHLGRRNVVSGPEAYKKLFRMTVDYLRYQRGLKNMLVAFSPDKLCKHARHTCEPDRAMRDTVTDQELYQDFMSMYPGSQYVDVLGLDLYYSVNRGAHWETPEYQSRIFARYLKTISRIAEDEGKVAALTETGNYNLHNEVNKSSEWFTRHLLPLITGDKDIKLAYALTWENRSLNMTQYYIPYLGHAGYDDFKRFARDRRTMMLKDVGGLFSPNFGQGESSGKFPECHSFDSDPDGDGWGWEKNRSCKTAVCSSASTDPDGDGWGYEHGRSCKVKRD